MSVFDDVERFTQYFEEQDNPYAKDSIALTKLTTSWLLEIPDDGEGEIGKLYLSDLDMKRFIWWLNKCVNKEIKP